MSTFDCSRPRDSESRKSKELDKKITKWFKDYRKIIKILLLGAGESGKTTIIKQMRIIHIQGFTADEKQEKANEIRLNLLEAIKEVTLNMPQLVPPVRLDNPANQPSFDYIASLNHESNEGFVVPMEFYTHIKQLWSDPGVQEAFRRSAEYSLIDCAKYFLDRISEIENESYSPSDQDILQCRRRTCDIQKIEFEVKIPLKYGGGVQPFWMFDVGGQRGERRKWIQVFDGITAVLFLVACNEFDMKLREDNSTNRLSESLKVFEEVWYSRFLRTAGFILFLNKQDLLREKIERGVNLADHFPDYNHYKSLEAGHDPPGEYYRARAFIKDRFLQLTRRVPEHRKFSTGEITRHGVNKRNSITRSRLLESATVTSDRQHDCYAHFTVATDTTNIKTVFNDIHTMIVIWNLKTTLPA